MTHTQDSAPVFVDATGRRRRQVRRIAYAVGAACLTYTGLVGASVIGDPVRPTALAPFPMLSKSPVPDIRPIQTHAPAHPPAVLEAPEEDTDFVALPVRQPREAPRSRTAPKPPRRHPVRSPPPRRPRRPSPPVRQHLPTRPSPRADQVSRAPEPTGSPEPPEPEPTPSPTEAPRQAPSDSPSVIGGILDLLAGG
ncbi:hypothetical protein [Phytohabitans rumicis]|uniref:hypothetical protein n=1 Tax=Phytohabitans rumicis TaxID=1076125 RepID=UPI001563F56A|nr:hypothetical protein [Phytohabitans rumicis]